MTENKDAYLEALLETTQTQSQFIDELTHTVDKLAEQVDARPTKKVFYRVVGIIGGVLLALIVGLNLFTYSNTHETLEIIEGCLDPQEECAQQAAQSSQVARGQIICNQEKVLYLVFGADNLYDPLPLCAELVNTEIDRLDALNELPPGIEKVEVDPDVPQVQSFKSDFAGSNTQDN